MKKGKLQLKLLLVVASIVAVGATVALSGASANNRRPSFVPPDAAVIWNTNA